MLKVRIIPTLLWKNFSLVKGVSFESWRSVGSVLPAIKVYNSRDVDELILFDVCGNQGLSDPDFDSIGSFSNIALFLSLLEGVFVTLSKLRDSCKWGLIKFH